MDSIIIPRLHSALSIHAVALLAFQHHVSCTRLSLNQNANNLRNNYGVLFGLGNLLEVEVWPGDKAAPDDVSAWRSQVGGKIVSYIRFGS